MVGPLLWGLVRPAVTRLLAVLLVGSSTDYPTPPTADTVWLVTAAQKTDPTLQVRTLVTKRSAELYESLMETIRPGKDYGLPWIKLIEAKISAVVIETMELCEQAKL